MQDLALEQPAVPKQAHGRYRLPAIALHWVVAILIIGMIGIGLYMTSLPKGPMRNWYFELHKSLGLTAAAIILLRIVWRISHKGPALPAMPAWQMLAAKASHHLLYLGMVIMPLSGYLASSFTKYPIKWFGHRLPYWAWPDKHLNHVLDVIHSTTAYILIALVSIHVLAALKHLLVDRDGVFRRMLP